ncbi:SDR family NAD(P)-dependent oxidoreductase [Nocardioides humi]|uniref:SDR family oxidoreductase n=1 Tax=Nocardioides humi TaxID=449461 RepID=A0ABN2A4P4_9ACTN|nr:SDR family oxidoreductase [Nocardioides humi]
MDTDLLGLHGATVLVAGVGPGLGTSIARAFAQSGAHVVVAARRQESIQHALDAIAGDGGRASGLRADVTAAADRSRIVGDLADRGLDVLVYNASATGSSAGVADASLDEWRDLAEINVWSPIALVQETLPLLRRSQRAAVVMVSAMTTRMVSAPGRGGYAITKAALNQAVRTLAFELGPERIRVNAVLPGWMDTPLVQEWRADPARSAHVDRALADIPLGAIPHPDEVAGAAVFLASRLSASVTGELLDTNGGQYMRG